MRRWKFKKESCFTSPLAVCWRVFFACLYIYSPGIVRAL
nr:MAG TPA: hypothetical protein [Caudoviricetes sp.]